MKTTMPKSIVLINYKSIEKKLPMPAGILPVLLLLITMLPLKSIAQAPVISYSGPHTYTAGKSVLLAPTSTGVAAPGYNNPITLASSLTQPTALARDAAGNIYVLDFDQTRDSTTIKKIPVGGGTPIIIGSTSDEATAIAVDAPGNIYVVNNNLYNTLQKIPAGGGTPVTIAGYLFISGLFVDAAGNVFVATPVSEGWEVIMIQASGGAQVGIAALPGRPEGITFDAAGNLFYAAEPARRGQGSIQELLRGDVQSTQLGDASLVAGPLTTDALGNVYVGNYNTIKEIPAGTIEPVNLVTGLNNVNGIVIDGAGNFYITVNNEVEKISPAGGYYISPGLPAGLNFSKTTGIISGTPTVATPATTYTITAYNAFGSTSATVSIGTKLPALPTLSYNSPNTYARGATIAPLAPASSGVSAVGFSNSISIVGSGFNVPEGVATDAAGNIYVADTFNFSIKKIPASGGSPVTLTDTAGYVQFIAVDAPGNVYFAKIAFTGIADVTRVYKIPAGSKTPIMLYSSGTLSLAGIAVDATGNVYVIDSSKGTVQKIPLGSTNAIDIASGFASPAGIAIDAEKNIYVADAGNTTVKKIPATGGSLVNMNIGAGFQSPSIVAVDAAGNLYAGDNTNNILKMIPADGSPAVTINSTVSGPSGIAVDGAGNLYLADSFNNAIKKIAPVGGYAISPFLPKGLSFNNATGIISGTPTTGSPATDYTVTAWNAAGSSKAKVNIIITTPLPATQAQKVVFTDITTNSATVNWTNGSGTARAVFIAQKANGSALPAENFTYTANTAFGAGAEIGTTGWYSIYNGTGSTVNVTGLAAGTTYRVTVVEYYGNEGGEAYLNTKLSPASVTTVKIYPTVPALQVKFTNTTSQTTTANWINGDGARRAVFMHTGIYGNALPWDNTTYTANTKFGSGTQIGTSGWYCIYDGTGSTVNITGLTTYSAYRVTVVEYNGAPGNQKYAVTKLSPGNVYTNALPSLNSLYIPGNSGQTASVFSLNSETVEANNILSPNGDGINDIWVVKNIAFYPNNTVSVYDRAGKVVFTKRGYTNDWDGTYRGSVLSEGTYYYLVDLGNGNNIKGFITVVTDR